MKKEEILANGDVQKISLDASGGAKIYVIDFSQESNYLSGLNGLDNAMEQTGVPITITNFGADDSLTVIGGSDLIPDGGIYSRDVSWLAMDHTNITNNFIVSVHLVGVNPTLAPVYDIDTFNSLHAGTIIWQ